MPAPVVEKKLENSGGKKLMEEKMIAQIISKYDISSGDGRIPSSWEDAKYAGGEVIEQLPTSELPKPLKRVDAPTAVVVEKTIPEKAPIEKKSVKEIYKNRAAAIVEEDQARASKTSASSKVKDESKEPEKLVWPVSGEVIKQYKPGKDEDSNDGLNIEAALGSPVVAVASGKVLYSTNQGNFGNLICISHKNGLISVYAHLKEMNVVKGDTVEKGEKIGSIGKTGNVKTPQLHFELRKKAKGKVESFDPEKMLEGQSGS
jgi:murein DD-endopeptidase MepM/ murein hydrolase activator NlpD